jgi:hypothetical protein
MKHPGLVLVIGMALAVRVAASNDMATARLRLVSGREFECVVLHYSNDILLIQRSFGSGWAREHYARAQIEGLYFPRPAWLTDVATQTWRDARLLRATIATVAVEYAAWRAFKDIRGGWAPQAGLAYARLLEQAGRRSSAARVYSAVARNAPADIRRCAALRGAVCGYYLLPPSNALARLQAAADSASTDAERAELTYYIGLSHARLNQPVQSLFALLRNVVLYGREAEWEGRSLIAALPNYAALDRRDEFMSTCATLFRRYPDLRCARSLSNMYVMLVNGSNLQTFANLTLYAVELPK